MARTRLATAAAAATLVLCATSAASAATVSPDAKPAQAAPAPTGAPATCGYTKAVPADKFQGIPVFDAAKAAKPFHATVRTSQGSVTFQALTAAAPCTTFSFRFLAEHHYFNDTHCHRLTTQGIFVLQCGDPTGTGSGGPGYSFNDENLTGATYPAGTVAMANAGPNTNGSQFFFVWKDTKLPPAYTPFGQVTGGLDVLQKIAAGGEDDQNGAGDGFPTLPVNIHGVKISNH
ncbi:peptidylprolyl isomerase [Kitasatospora sp. NPDC008050]|uniref:peptidylprolyl isomerase n=1 Tax=Kitasatospora sp. NPDC008050 TaxID=3364021 RepID=UPI0036EBE577